MASNFSVWHKTRNVGCKCDFCTGCWYELSPSVDGKMMIGHYKTGVVHDLGCLKTNARPVINESPIAAIKITVAPPGGCRCARCKLVNEYAAPNKPDGSYVCFSCR